MVVSVDYKSILDCRRWVGMVGWWLVLTIRAYLTLQALSKNGQVVVNVDYQSVLDCRRWVGMVGWWLVLTIRAYLTAGVG